MEKTSPPSTGHVLPERYWIMMAGGKYDFTAKWWNPANYQRIVDHFQGRIQFVQAGEAGHWHPPLSGVINVVGKTTTREFVQLMHHADGVVCPVTFAMHLAAAVETRPGRPKQRPCVVIAGGREPTQWEAYPHHQYISTTGMLSCCQEGGCWKSRCQLVGDGDPKDFNDVCDQPVQITPHLRVPRCMDMISADDVIRRIEMYLSGDVTNGGRTVESDHSAATRCCGLESTLPDATTVLQINNFNFERDSRSPASQNVTTQNILITFRHGLGDAVQFTAVLRHLQYHHPEWNVDVLTLVGKHSAFEGLCRRVCVIDRDPIPTEGYHQRFDLTWDECRTEDASCPNTKVLQCIRDAFQLSPIPDLFRYQIRISDTARIRAHQYLESICGPPGDDGRYRAVLIHYEGNTSGEFKNLPTELIQELCADVIRLGYVPVILDWDRRSPLPDQQTIFCPDAAHVLWDGQGTGDAEQLAALINSAKLMIGIDSGPLHVAGATETPSIGVWTRHHPVHFFDLADNLLHLVPVNHSDLVQSSSALNYFDRVYPYETYQNLNVSLLPLVEHRLTGAAVEPLRNKQFLKQLTATGYDRSYYDEHKNAGLDYLGFGGWQQQYGRWLVESLGYQGRKMLDVGCACGSILRGLGQAGAIVQGVDLCEPMIQLGRQQWPDMAPLLFVCDAINLHLFTDRTWDGLHSAQVAEHWKPELVPFILRELGRVTVPDGLFFCSLDTSESFARQGRTLENEDPTHICIQPISWWQEQLEANGWEVCTAEYEPILRQHPEDFLCRYDWDFFIARRRGG
ncbi:glycosyltransferase family 9 protein, partial [Schlesneria sp.]|uniref:glycosyltransferase family 9 protein n=1 Tax=Schlesneria sp. TaxID=2762018 RepID=UPI002EF29204